MAIEPASVDWNTARRVSYMLRQSFRYEYPKPIRDLNHRLVVIPPERFGDQRRLRHQLSVDRDGVRFEDRQDRFGNMIVDVFAPRVPEEIEFVYDAFVVRKDRAKALRASVMTTSAAAVQATMPGAPVPSEFTLVSPDSGQPTTLDAGVSTVPTKILLRVKGAIPPELWNGFGSKIIPKLRSAEQLKALVELTVEVDTSASTALEMEVQQILSDLDLGGKVAVEKDPR